MGKTKIVIVSLVIILFGIIISLFTLLIKKEKSIYETKEEKVEIIEEEIKKIDTVSLVNKIDDYSLYCNNDKCYIVKDEKKYEATSLYENIYKFDLGIYNVVNNYVLIGDYKDIEVGFNNTVILTKDNKILYSLNEQKNIIESKDIINLNNGNFIIINDKYILIDNKGKILFDNLDNIFYNKDIGYILINNEDIKLYNEKLKQIKFSKYDKLDLDSNTYIVSCDIKDNNYFIYNSDNYSGINTFIINPNYIYLIKNNKIIKLEDYEFKN